MDCKIIISLTTIPSRINYIEETLKTLFNQDYPIDHISLALPSKWKREPHRSCEIPTFISNSSKIKILQSDKDWGPATKLIPLLQQIKSIEESIENTYIVVVDDDRLYPKNMVRSLVEISQKYPQTAICLGGSVISYDPERQTHQHKGFSEKIYHSYNLDQNNLSVDIMRGQNGFLIKPYFFDDDLYDYDQAPKSAFFTDDIWFSAYLAKNNINRLLIARKNLIEKDCQNPTTNHTYSLQFINHAQNCRNNITTLSYLWNYFNNYNLREFSLFRCNLMKLHV